MTALADHIEASVGGRTVTVVGVGNRLLGDDADIHWPPFSIVALTSGSFTTTPSAQRTPASAPNWASRLSTSC